LVGYAYTGFITILRFDQGTQHNEGLGW